MQIENIYSLSPLFVFRNRRNPSPSNANLPSTLHSIAQIYVHGDSLEDHVVAVVVPDPEKFAALASKALGKHIVASDAAALAAATKEKKVVEAVGAELAPYAKDARLLKSVSALAQAPQPS
jgi:long-subunit acyl-CoA synthetase (AMP-forming)